MSRLCEPINRNDIYCVYIYKVNICIYRIYYMSYWFTMYIFRLLQRKKSSKSKICIFIYMFFISLYLIEPWHTMRRLFRILWTIQEEKQKKKSNKSGNLFFCSCYVFKLAGTSEWQSSKKACVYCVFGYLCVCVRLCMFVIHA